MPTKPVTLRLPEELLEAIDAQVFATNSNRTEVVVKALQQVFSPEGSKPSPTEGSKPSPTEVRKPAPAEVSKPSPTPDSTLVRRIEDLEAKLSKAIAQLEGDLVSRLTERVNALEEGLASVETPPKSEPPRETPTTTKRQKKTAPVEEPKETPPKTATAAPPNGRRTRQKTQKKSEPAPETPKTTTATLEVTEEAAPTKRRGRSKSSEAPPAPKAKRSGEWLTVKEAFEQLGGNPADPESVVNSNDNSRSVKLNRFRVLSASDYESFGLEFRPDRRRRRLPCLRYI